MSDLRRKSILPRLPQMSAQWLKTAAVILMLLANIGEIVLERGIIGLPDYTLSGLLEAMDTAPHLTGLVGCAALLRLCGGVAVPIFAFLLVEGYVHTASYKSYLLRLSVTALVSELCYDFAMTGSLLELTRQNPMLALVVGLAMLGVMGLLERFDTVERVIGQILLTLCGLFWVMLLRIPFGLETILLISIFYCFRERKAVKILLGITVSLAEPTGPLAFCALAYYNGQRKLRVSKYLFYVLYPLHLLVLGVIARFVL